MSASFIFASAPNQDNLVRRLFCAARIAQAEQIAAEHGWTFNHEIIAGHGGTDFHDLLIEVPDLVEGLREFGNAGLMPSCIDLDDSDVPGENESVVETWLSLHGMYQPDINLRETKSR